MSEACNKHAMPPSPGWLSMDRLTRPIYCLFIATSYKMCHSNSRKAKKNAKDLRKFQTKFQKAEIQFKTVMKSLPNKEEIPSLLTSISQSGQDSGLEFLLFQPKGEKRKGFYAEIPVSMKITGSFHNVVIFFEFGDTWSDIDDNT